MLNARLRTLATSLTFASLLATGFSAHAKSTPYSEAFESRVRAQFYDGSKVSAAKVDAMIARLTQKKNEIAAIDQSEVVLKADKKGKDPKQKNLIEAVLKSKSVAALELAIQKVQAMRSAASFAEICDLAAAESDLEGAIRIEGKNTPLATMRRAITALLSSWKISKSSEASKEATNLWDPTSQQYLGAAEIDQALKAGKDLSVFGPAKSVFWVPQANIAAVDVAAAARGETMPIYDGVGQAFPAQMTFIYDEVKKSDSKPKIDAYVENAGKKQKFKLKFGGEINADPTVAAALMTLGYPQDLTKYAQHIKLVLGKKTKLSDLKREWESYYSRDRTGHPYKIEDYIENTGTDAQGNAYVTFKEGLIEAKPSSLSRVGPWKYSDGDHTSMREVRGMVLAEMWLANTDLKEFDNNQVLLKKNADGSISRMLINSDPGHALAGSYLGLPQLENPTLFSWSMIANESSDALTIRYRAVHQVSIKDKMTWSDARWAARLIAQMTRSQIEAVVAEGHWPACIDKIYVEKLISRRNSLVSALGLLSAKNADGSTIALLPETADRDALKLNSSCSGPQALDTDSNEKRFGANFDTVVSPFWFL